MKLESERLFAKPFETSDFQDFVRLLKNKESSKLMGKGLISDLEIEARFKRILSHQKELEFSAWAVFEKKTKNFVGRCGLVKIGTLVETDEDHSDKIEIGYAFLPEFWGQGYCQEIVPLFLEYGFEALKLTEIFAKTAKDNNKSRHLLMQKFHFIPYCDVLVEGKESEIFILKSVC
jgi:[ribosomal protein S5]-alanine N-acetyltransferase